MYIYIYILFRKRESSKKIRENSDLKYYVNMSAFTVLCFSSHISRNKRQETPTALWFEWYMYVRKAFVDIFATNRTVQQVLFVVRTGNSIVTETCSV